MKYVIRNTPYGEYQTDSDFTITEQRFVGGGKGYGIAYYAGGESWGFVSSQEALAHARRYCLRHHTYNKGI